MPSKKRLSERCRKHSSIGLYICSIGNTLYYVQHGKKALISYADSEGPDERVHLENMPI